MFLYLQTQKHITRLCDALTDNNLIIFEMMVSTPRADLTFIEDELSAKIPEPLHSKFADKEDQNEDKERYKARKNKETVICPPTCSGTLYYFINFKFECCKLFRSGSSLYQTDTVNQMPNFKLW